MNPPTQSSPMLRLSEAATYLRVSKAHLSNVINGKVPGVPTLRTVRAGRCVLIKREWIEEWLESTSRKAAV